MVNQQPDISELVEGFATHIKALKSTDYREAQLRDHYLDPFWKLLGWDVDNSAQRGPREIEVIVEPSVDVAEGQTLRARRPDYIFRLNGFPRFVVEAKKPAVDLDADLDAIYQAKRYAWSSTIPFAILTDFEQFRLFDTTLKPVHSHPLRGLVDDFKLNYQHYPTQWDVLLTTFGREAVAAGSLERLLAKVRKVPAGRRIRTVDRMLIDLRGGEPVDRAFLACLDTHRRHFARAIYRDNRKLFPEADTLHGAARLTEAVQRLMDRLVFMRVCEDRDIAPWGGLRETLDRIAGEGGDLYEALHAEFRRLDRSYNGYLFKPHDLEELGVDGGVLADFIRDLYPPDGPWDFSAIGDDILGIVYERFLGNVVTVRGRQAEVEEKPEVRHAGGVYYTPRFVVDTIIRRVVGPKIEGKTPLEVLDVKILDPACGSGSFLVATLQFLFDHCTAAILNEPALAKLPVPGKSRKKKPETAFQDKDGRWFLAPDFRAALLTNCIHGVDIDQQAVEVTVMSLYLKMLEAKLPAGWQHDWVENRLLPPLDNNIRCGNSLISPGDYLEWWERSHKTLWSEDKDTEFRINRFDWLSRTRGFGRLLDKRAAKERGRAGFDCIIGNPPYIRVQELNKWAPEECEFYKWKYESAKKGNYDIYVVFTEKALSLLTPDGLLGFIMPHKFWQAAYGAGLRELVAAGQQLRSVIDFKEEQVFNGVTTYTAIHVFSRDGKCTTVDYASVSPLTDGVSQMAGINAAAATSGVEYVTAAQPGAGIWAFLPPGMLVRDHIVPQGVRSLADVARLAQGIKTSADKVFVLDVCGSDGPCLIVRSAQTGRQHRIEKGILWPLIKSEHMRRYVIEPSDKVLLFPYDETAGRFTAIAPSRWRDEFPMAWVTCLGFMYQVE